ncbi:hypothetical protein [Candidatus Palauibacter sp.]|uniref:hypothetical protein n=1 Tax=Candidatus Palauibacter sp. TaxID=3101350 RepID=UPI003B01B4D9
MCRLPGLSPSGHYAWRKRDPSGRARVNAALTEGIVEIHAMSGYLLREHHGSTPSSGRGSASLA